MRPHRRKQLTMEVNYKDWPQPDFEMEHFITHGH